MEHLRLNQGNIVVSLQVIMCNCADGSFAVKDDAVASKDTVRPKDTAVSKEASEIFGTSKNDANLNEPIGFQETLDATVKPTAFTYSFANAVSARFANTLYGYFIGDRLAFPLVENYVNNTWAKYGLKRIQLHENFFMFQFNTKEGMESVMANGPWLIRYVPLILNIWTPTTDLKKDVISTAPLNTYARVLVEFSADEELKKSIVVAIPRGNGKGHTLVTVDVEYEWTPPRCSICKVFDHKSEKCPTLPKVDVMVNEKNDGFTEVKRKKRILNASDDEVDEELLVGKDGTVTFKNPGGKHSCWTLIYNDYALLSLEIGIGRRMVLGVTKVLELFWDGIVMELMSLWKSLCKHKAYIRNRPWSIMGDFNASLFPNESTAGSSKVDISMRDFRDCVEEIEVSDVQSSGLQFTWNQKPQGGIGIMKKLDRIMVNDEFRDQFMGAHAIFKPYRISDHSPSVLCIPTMNKMKPKLLNSLVLTSHDRFLDVIKEEWTHYISGFHMYRVVKKLKNLKKPLRKLMYDKGNLHSNVTRLRDDLDVIQAAIDSDPFNMTFRDREAVCIADFNQAVLMEERFLKQKAKIKWLKEGDSNSAYYHKMVKSRVSKSRIDVVTNAEGVLFENDNVPNAFVTHYEMFLGHAGDMNEVNLDNLFKSRINDLDALDMVREVTNKEVKDALFSMGDDKSPGPDGYTAAFFKEAWSIVEVDVSNAIREFFRNGTILKELNHTIIALIPKVKAPMRVNDYRPISCCNVLFKCISKIIANRIKYCLKFIVSPNQSAFVPGRSITDNILLTQELMHNYHLDRGIPRCAFKVDIQKAYDTVDWSFLRMILHGFGFPDKMIAWIMECVSTTSYSISINGSLHGYFKGKRGLRQGDPLSPYLFTLVMEVLTLMLQRRVSMTEGFTYHRYCSKMDLINLCFADDLFLFAYGDVNSASIIKESLDEFKNASGLVPSLPKSTAYFCNVLNHVKLSILQILPFEEGRLPDWKNKALSIAGRLQLIQSVLGSMHIYWASVFTLPSSVLLNIEQILRQFLWNHGSSGKAKSKVAWEIVCLPKDEGGLGIRRLECFNSALMASHIWKLLTLKESLWVKWIHEYKLKGRNFWDYPMRGNMSWGWRKILRLRPVIRRFIWSKLGNGHATSLWFDKWSTLEPLANFVSPRDVARAGLSLKSKVSDVLVYGNWSWPNDLVTKYPILPNYNTPINNELDRLVWSDRFGNIQKFSVSQVWSDIRSRNTRLIESVVAKLVVAATAYYIWQERNWRLFQKGKRKVDQIVDCIKTVVRLKLLSCKLKKSKSGERLARLWDLPDAIFI
ncbi:hypothetical protein Tco_1111725 [Tanacetum coccineum]|uniref:Reverse transcriptase domain-containing protein n=1 Tax=Tanacetum coccineum TaxID=301880 RepID=A0ABQ5IMJ8_9ASTR